jgi:hypothetical protein
MGFTPTTCRKHDSGQTGNQELKQEPDAKQHGCIKAELAAANFVNPTPKERAVELVAPKR